MSYNRKSDGNQPKIVQELRDCGLSVEVLSRVGHGIPDLMVADDERQVWVEIKEPGKKLTPYEKMFFARWPQQLRIVAECTEDVLRWFGRL